MAAPPAHAQPTVTIAAAASLSGGVNISPRGTESSLVEIVMPAVWTAANLTFQTSNDGVTYQDYYAADGTEVTVIAAAARNIGIAAVDFAGAGWLKVRSGTALAPVVQGAARVITLITRSVA